jgi:Uma2 family endonuclease
MSYFTAHIDEEGKIQVPEHLREKFKGEVTLHIQTDEVAPQYELFPIKLQLPEEVQMNYTQFVAFSELNEGYAFSLTSNHEILIEPPMLPTGSRREGLLLAELIFWNRQYKLGDVFGPTARFEMPDGGLYQPDTAFIAFTKLNKVDRNSGAEVATLVPDFVIELISESDRLKASHEKMQEVWIKNGVKVAMLIDYKKERYFVYEAGKEGYTEFPFSTSFSHEEVLPHFGLNLEELAKEW